MKLQLRSDEGEILNEREISDEDVDVMRRAFDEVYVLLSR